MSAGWIGGGARSSASGTRSIVTAREFLNERGNSLNNRVQGPVQLPPGYQLCDGQPYLCLDPAGVVRKTADVVQTFQRAMIALTTMTCGPAMGRSANLNQRQGADDRVEHNSDDESIDDFGRKKKKRRKDNASASSTAKSSQAGKTVDEAKRPKDNVEPVQPAQPVLAAPAFDPGQRFAGDWDCASCGFSNFAKNLACRQCGAPKPSGSASALAGLRGVDVEMFLSRNRVASYAADQLRSLSANEQKHVIMRGSLMDARDPTAVLIARMGQVRAKYLAGEL